MISVYLSHQSTANGVRSTVRYMCDATHRDHEGKYSISQPSWHLAASASADGFADCVAEAAEKMRSVRRPSGKKWDSDLSQHLAFSLPPGVRLSASERNEIEHTLIETIAPYSPACVVWHTPLNLEHEDADKKRRLHCHMVVASATICGRHRLTQQRRMQGAAGEQGLLRIAATSAIEAVNRTRLFHGRGEDLLPSPHEAVQRARQRRLEARCRNAEFKPICWIVADALDLGERVDEQCITSTLRGLGWKVVQKPEGRIALTPPGRKKSFDRITCYLVEDVHDALEKRRAKARAGIVQRDTQQPERPTSGPEVES